jgi:hypothetical protein
MNDLTEMTESQFRKIRNLGKSSQEIVINRMIELGLQFKPEEEESVNEEPVEEETSEAEPSKEETPKMERMYERYNHRCNISDLAPESTDSHCEDDGWTYECPLHKALSEIISSIKETMDKIDIIRRDNYETGGYDLLGMHVNLRNFQMKHEIDLQNISVLKVIIPATIVPSQRDEIIECAKRIANKYNFNIKFIHLEDILYPVIQRPTNITVDRLAQIDSEFRLNFPVEPYVIK